MPHYYIDIETYQKEGKEYKPTLNTHNFTLGCVYKNQNKKPLFFDTRKEMRQYLHEEIEKNAKQNKKTYIFAHNMKYDFYALYQDKLIEFETEKYGGKIIEGNQVFLAFYKTAIYLDTLGYYKMSLKKLGELIGLPKLEMPKNPTTIEEIKPYLERDTAIVRQSHIELKNKLKDIGLRINKWSTGMRLAMTAFMQYTSKQTHTDPYATHTKSPDCKLNENYNKYQEILKQQKISMTKFCKVCHPPNYISYLTYPKRTENGITRTFHRTQYPKEQQLAVRGGRTEVYQKGKFNNVTMVDINSFYPWILSEMPIPDIRTELRIQNPDRGILKYEGIIKARIKAPYKWLPYLHIRYGRKVYFPHGAEITSWWTTHEIKKAEEEGYKILELLDSVVYPKELPFNPFKEYMQRLYKIKREEGMMGYVAKILLNGLTGKLAQQKREYDQRTVHRSETPEWIEKGYKLVGTSEEYDRLQFLGEPLPSTTAHPILTALCYARAKTYLYEHLKQIPREDLLYCSTDSIVFKGDHINKFEIGKEMGEWKIEHENTTATIAKEGQYRIGDKIKTTGIGKNDWTIELFDQYADGSELTRTRLYSYKMGWKESNFDQIGKLYTDTIQLRGQPKRWHNIPAYINETT